MAVFLKYFVFLVLALLSIQVEMFSVSHMHDLIFFKDFFMTYLKRKKHISQTCAKIVTTMVPNVHLGTESSNNVVRGEAVRVLFMDKNFNMQTLWIFFTNYYN